MGFTKDNTSATAVAVLETAIFGLLLNPPLPGGRGTEGGRSRGELPNKKDRIGHDTIQGLKIFLFVRLFGVKMPTVGVFTGPFRIVSQKHMTRFNTKLKHGR